MFSISHGRNLLDKTLYEYDVLEDWGLREEELSINTIRHE